MTNQSATTPHKIVDENTIREKRGLHTLVARNMDPDEFLGIIIGEKFKKYRERWDLAGKSKNNTPYPLHVNFEVSYGCNYKCKMCMCSLPYNKWGHNVEPKKNITFDKYKEVVDEGVPLGLGAVSLNGYNEPLLQKDIVRYVQYAKYKGVPDIFFVTNASLLTKEISHELLESELTRIMFSLDAATSETYALLRNDQGFENVISQIRYFLKLKEEKGLSLPLTRVSFVQNRQNIHEQKQFEEYWKDKVDYVFIQRFHNSFLGNRDIEGSDKIKNVQLDYRMTSEQMSKYGVKQSPQFFDCYQPFQRLYISNNGDVHPCCASYGMRLVLGNIYKNSLLEIWNNKETQSFRKIINDEDKQPEICRLCRKAQND